MRQTVACGLIGALAALFPCTPAFAADNKYCLPDSDNVVVYVDRTTPYDDLDKKALVDGVALVFEALEGGERFSIRSIADSFATSERLVEACVPICANQGFLDDLFSDCTEGVMINDRKKLKTRIVQTLQKLLANFVELPNSEIVRTLALSTAEEMRQNRRNRVFLFSDLIENSVYLPGKEFFSTRTKPLLAKLEADGLVPDWQGTVVHVFGVGRSGKPGRPPLDQPLLEKLTEFWRAYFDGAGATVSIQQSLSAE